MRLMEDDYSYNYTQFYGKTGAIFTLVGSSMPKVNSRIENTVDSFKTVLGEFIELTRVEILEQVNKGKMMPVEESRIKTVVMDSKEWGKKAGRGI